MNNLTSQAAKVLWIVLIVFVNLAIVKAGPDMGWANKVGARKIPQKRTVFVVNDYGAANDGKTIATAFIQKAIDECARRGGGIVSFKPGAYLTGAIFLKSNVHLKIDK